jgi:hypothetical protein
MLTLVSIFDSFKTSLAKGSGYISPVYNPLASSFIGTYFLHTKDPCGYINAKEKVIGIRQLTRFCQE